MRLQIPEPIIGRICGALRECGPRECGGILMGEHVAHELFGVADISVSTKSGTVSRFFRAVADYLGKLSAFFTKTNYQYKQFNYLGEWHSHPLFALQPSTDDFETMRAIVDDPAVGARFAVLMIVKLEGDKMAAKAWSIIPGGQLQPVEIEYMGVSGE